MSDKSEDGNGPSDKMVDGGEPSVKIADGDGPSDKMALSVGGQFALLMWKNGLLQSRKKVVTVLQIVMPTLGVLLFFGIRFVVSVTRYDSGVTWPSFGVDKLQNNYTRKVKLAYAPNVTAVDRIIARLQNDLGIKGVGYADEASLVEAFAAPEFNTRMWGGLVFTNTFPDENTFPNKILYKLRPRSEDYKYAFKRAVPRTWFTQSMYPGFQRPGPRELASTEGGRPGYAYREFLTFMHAVDKALATEVASPGETPERVTVQLQRFPYPPYVDDMFVEILQSQLPLLIIIGFAFTVPDLASSVTLEKEKRLKEYMKIMGLSNWLHWVAWFVKSFLILFISVVLMTILFVVKTEENALVNAADTSVIFVFLLLYAVSCICFSFMISTFFKKATTSAGAAGILFYLTYIPAMSTDLGSLDLPLILVSCLFNNIALAMGCRQIALYEGSGAGQRWSNLALPVSQDDDLTMGHVFLMLIVDSLIYLLITWYVENVFPGEYGIPRPFYFPFTREYWLGPPEDSEEGGTQGRTELDPEFFEPLPNNVAAGISIRNLRKEFKRGNDIKVAVAGTTIDMLEGQVTALLGHNGAGKTTTMNMLTGFMPPTGGTAIMNGFDIRTQMKHVRGSLGLCPQHNVLFDKLTVEEHLIFYAKLRGCPGKQVEAVVTEMIRLLGLEDKAKVFSKALSGGMKRKLSMGIALIYGSKIVVLDEPTSGMDPEARRKAWDILQSQREGRTVLLSTHFMDEADLLGDRIAIMAEGVVKCCGSSLFLKNKYGVGYHLVMVKEETCDVNAVTNFIVKHVPDAKLESNVSAELSYCLPHESSGQFEEMFMGLEENSTSLGIQSFGASVTTMEEVFMKVGQSCHDDVLDAATPGAESRDSKIDIGFTNKARTPEDVPVKKYEGIWMLLQQFKGMFIKGMLTTWRNRKIMTTQILMPVIFTMIGIMATRKGGPKEVVDPPPRVLYVGDSADQTVLYALNTSTSNSSVYALRDAFKSGLQGDASNFRDVTSEGLEKYLIGLGENSMDTYSRNYLIGAELTGTEPLPDGTETVLATGLFNSQTYHAIAMALAAIDEAILKYVTSNMYTLQVTNHPLPERKDSDLERDSQRTVVRGFVLAIEIIFGVSFMVATFAVFIVKEEATDAKHLQFVSGVQTGTYWLALYAWHLINYLIPATLILVMLIQGGLAEFKGIAGGITFLLLLFYGMAILPLTYLLSFMFKKPSNAYQWIAFIHVFAGVTSVVTISVLTGLRKDAIVELLRPIFHFLIPNFSMGIGFQDIYTNYNNKKMCTSNAFGLVFMCRIAEIRNMSAPCCPDVCARNNGLCIPWTDNLAAWEYPGIGRSLFFLFLQVIIFFLLLFFFESGTFKSLGQRMLEGMHTAANQSESDRHRRSDSIYTRPLLGEDSDVAEERKLIHDTPTKQLEQQSTVVLKELRKFYGGFLAVDRLSLAIPSGECFGLLGVNGAGKTTTFKMLTGDIPVSSGDAFLDGYSVKRDIKEVQRRLGYCPQFDALLDQMTVEETLYMYARLRGIKDVDIPGEVTHVISSLLLEEHAKKRCSELSGGNKRKLSTAMAIIGDPPVVFLDEPTTGMDPVARRSLWDTLTTIRQQGRTLVLTSHSMEECEALCTRLAIMVNGQFKCLGSVQHLKANCGEGYTLLAKVGGQGETDINNKTERLSTFVQEQFPGSELKDLHHGYIHYRVKSAGVSWAKIFGTLERAKVDYCIQDYSVSQTTLEQVFINLARSQVTEREKGLSMIRKIKNCVCFCCKCGCCKNSAPISEV